MPAIKRKTHPSHADLLRRFHYDPITGEIVWRTGTWSGHPAGFLSLAKTGKKVLRITIDDTAYPAARIVWFYRTGQFPAGNVQAIDRDYTNMRWSNLRVANVSQRVAGAKIPSTNTSGVKGVSWSARAGKWKAATKHKGLAIHLGYYADIADAAEAYAAATYELWGDYALGGDCQFQKERPNQCQTSASGACWRTSKTAAK